MSLVVVRVAGLATVQDLGRRGHMHEAVPPGGALVHELLLAANRAVANPDAAAAIELLGRLVARAETAVDVAVAGTVEVREAAGTAVAATIVPDAWGAVRYTLRAGSELVVASEPRRVAYLAIRGGVDTPLVLGGRGVLLAAGLGAPLRAGDRIAAETGTLEAARVDERADLASAAPIRVVPGPDLAAFGPGALDVLASAPYRILPTSDRVGTRLDGPRLPRLPGGETSRPMVRGAIEVPSDGGPIVLGPDHPTTGGYPILGVIASADLGRFFATRFGGSVWFAA
jgi:biotin-dependent carboxylase-like uncharacterized protein